MSPEAMIALIKSTKEIIFKADMQLTDTIMNLSKEELDEILNDKQVAWQWIKRALDQVIEEEKANLTELQT